MAARMRQSRQSEAIAIQTQPRQSNTQPAYETPSFPLNPAAQRALDQLLRAHSLRKLDDGLEDAQESLKGAAASINDRVFERENKTKTKKTAAEGSTPEGNDEVERRLEELREKVQRMTQRMDDSMRKMIDGRHAVESIKASINSTSTDARDNASTQASTQPPATQRRRGRGVGEDGEEDSEGDDEYQDFTPTDPRGGTQAQKTPIDVFRTKLEENTTRYQSKSLTARYAEDNKYRDFKRLVHDARHREDGVPLAHHSEWFDEGQLPAPGVTTRARKEDDEDDSDDDLAVSRLTVSTKCPLTLQEFKKPVTSNNCPHSFESEAILGLLSASHQRRSGRAGEKVVQCPVSGCSQIIGQSDLRSDPVIIRQIHRLQRSRALDAEEAEENNNADRSNIIEDGEDDAADVDAIVEGRSTIKGEPSSKSTAAVPSSVPRATQGVVELDSGTEAEEDEDGDQTMSDA